MFLNGENGSLCHKYFHPVLRDFIRWIFERPSLFEVREHSEVTLLLVAIYSRMWLPMLMVKCIVGKVSVVSKGLHGEVTL